MTIFDPPESADFAAEGASTRATRIEAPFATGADGLFCQAGTNSTTWRITESPKHRDSRAQVAGTSNRQEVSHEIFLKTDNIPDIYPKKQKTAEIQAFEQIKSLTEFRFFFKIIPLCAALGGFCEKPHMSQGLRTSFLLAGLLLACAGSWAASEEEPLNASHSLAEQGEEANHIDVTSGVTTLQPVTVIGRPEDILTGVNSYDRQILERLPARNDSINEAISIMPGLQLPEQSRSSLTAGEIIPPLLSISGGKTFQNNFLIDGLTNNSLLDPAAQDPTSITTVPGHPQALFLNKSLVEEINVYRYNIPARYGQFTGGVIEAETRTPGSDFYGELSYRTTRDTWTRFHLEESIDEDFEDSNRASLQPQFEKHFGGILLNIPVRQGLNLLSSYQINSSDIPLQQIGETRSQTRSNENYFFKLAWEIDNWADLEATLQYAPYEGDYFYPDAKDSDFTVEGGGYVAGLEYRRILPLGVVNFDAAWKFSENNRKGPSDLRPWLVSPDKPWGTVAGTTIGDMPVSFEGGVGSIETWQEGFEINFGLQDMLIEGDQITHQISTGLGFERVTGHFERAQPTSSYFIATSDEDVVCPPEVNDCIDGQQYFDKRLFFAADSISGDINFYEAHLEDKMRWGKLEVRPGVHVAHDDFMKNTNVAPRLAASYDLFGDRRSVLFGGLNRYYGSTLLTYKLREASQPFQTQLRDPSTLQWVPQAPLVLPDIGFVNDRRGRPFLYSELDTPYTDETVLGINQRLFGGQLVLAWVQREGRDEFVREAFELPATLEDGTSYAKESYRLTNNGERSHDEYNLEWERAWQKHYLAVNVTFQETETNNEHYSNPLHLGDFDTLVWYEGKFLNLDELPRLDFNRPWIVNLVYSARLPWDIIFTNVTRYQSGYEGLDKLSNAQKEARGLPAATLAYQKDQKPESWVFDWQFSWSRDLSPRHRLNLNLEIDNVFNQRAETGDPDRTLAYQTYQTGRQFWLGLTYSF